jgi:NAD(P)-dependent dehydrogenase (short-subunit alcohol dehydrogenase family)
MPTPRSRAAWFASDPLLAGFSAWKPSAEFRGKSVVVTGGASGIGRAIAVAFALEGARVTILDRDAARGRATARLLRRLSPRSGFVRVDLRDAAAVARAGRLFAGPRGAGLLVNNAAMVGRIAPFHELDWKDCAGVLHANLSAPFLLAQRAAAGLVKARRQGSIINILTIQTVLPVPGYSAYIASKGGLDSLTLSMATDLAPHGIRVNGVRVGCVLTENYLAVLPPALKREVDSAGVGVLDQRVATLLGRMGQPAEIARVVLFLASEKANYLTGSIVRADGGRAISRKAEPLL